MISLPDRLSAQVWLRAQLLMLATQNPAVLITDPSAEIARLEKALALPASADADTCFAHFVALKQALQEGLQVSDALSARVQALAAILLASSQTPAPQTSSQKSSKR